MIEKWIAGAGAALVDILVEESDQFLKDLNAQKGGMTMVEFEEIQSILKKSNSPVKIVPGGSACNTIVGIAHLGGKASMIGKLGDDKPGKLFSEGLRTAGADFSLGKSQLPTGQVLSVVTPDAQRTMFTFLGASAELSPADMDADKITRAEIIHLEGYLLFNPEVVKKIIAIKNTAKAKLSLDLASFEVVEACRELIMSILPEVDILIANEDEAKAFTGLEEEAALKKMAEHAQTAIVKLGKKGALISQDNVITKVEAELVNALDTTGAGDLWAAGFLYGLVHDYSMKNAGQLGAKVASEVVQVMGAAIPEEGWKRILEFKETLEP